MNLTESRLIDAYNTLFQSLNFQSKLELLERLLQTVKTEMNAQDAAFYNAFGAFPDEKTAEEIIEDLKASRTFRTKDIQL